MTNARRSTVRRFGLYGGAIAFAALLLGATTAGAGTDPACVAQARADFKDCSAQCKDDYASAKLACRNIDPACGKACLAGRQVCFDAVEAILETGLLPGGAPLAADCTGGTDACKAQLTAATQACGAPCGPADQACHDCVDTAQIADFVCRDACRDDWRVNPTVIAMKKACADGFKACMSACKP